MRQQQEQIAALQALLAKREGEGEVKLVVSQPNTESNVEVVKLQMFNGAANKILGFLIVYRLYIRMRRMRDAEVKEQIQQVFSYVQKGLANVQKEYVIEDLKNRSLSYVIVGNFLSDLKKKFGSGDDETIKIAELKKVEQGSKTMKEFVQKFRKAARDNGYEEKPLVEEFKRGMNGMIRRKLMEAERSSRSIDQQYKHTTNLDKHWREC